VVPDGVIALVPMGNEVPLPHLDAILTL